MLLHRFLSSVVLIPIVIGAVLLGSPYLDILALVIAGFMAWEWDNILKSKGNNNAIVCAMVASVCITLYFSLLIYIAMYIIIGMIFAGLVARKTNPEQKLFEIIGVPYVILPLVSLLVLRNIGGYPLIFLIFGIVWGTDIGGYIFGCTIKGPKLCPKISPSKTWSGLLGGMLLASVAGFVYGFIYEFQYLPLIAFSASMAVVSQIGDLFESYVKRRTGVKDSSNLIPGHGGILDRVDGLVFVAPVVLFIVLFFQEQVKNFIVGTM